ncbi:MAG: hypothetical protein HWD63_11725 [Candidatus Parvibacillus calidus]|nr:MAG: hypothetical protein HWD63_11725 [Candidatus Parvibacillus calidus]
MSRRLIATMLDGTAFRGGFANNQVIYSGIKFFICPQNHVCGGFELLLSYLLRFWEDRRAAAFEVGRCLIATMLDGTAFRGGFAKIQVIYTSVKFFICL